MKKKRVEKYTVSDRSYNYTYRQRAQLGGLAPARPIIHGLIEVIKLFSVVEEVSQWG